MRQKLTTFLELSWAMKVLLIRTVWTSAVVQFALTRMPFNIASRWLGTANNEISFHGDPHSELVRHQVCTAVRICANNVFWHPLCYAQALTAKIILKKYGISSTLYIGFSKSQKSIFYGHAFLRSYDTIIVGENGRGDFEYQYFFT